jgi:molybdate transport system substrate-binding protein
MTMWVRNLVCLALLLAIAVPTLAGPTRPIVVFAGSAAQPPLEAAAEAFQAKTGTPVVLQLGGSGAMLNQIRLTGLGDLYIPGSPDYMEKAREFDLIEDTEVTVAYLVPAIIVAKGNPLGIRGLHDLERPGLRIGIADPNGVCVGLYAVEILEANHLTHKVRPNLRGVVESCAKAAAMIPLNQVDAVLGWREFAGWQSDAMEAIPLNAGEVPRVAYIPAAILRHTQNRPGAKAFAAYLKSAEGQAIFEKWGYLTEESAARELAPQARIGGTYRLPEGW